jgi:hypothetical protein
MARGKAYTDTQRETFLALAQEAGPKAAREELGYPGERTAARWMTDAGVDWAKAPAAVYGQVMRQAYTDAELLSTGARLLDQVNKTLDDGVTHVLESGATIVLAPDPANLYRLAGVFGRVAETLRLVQGRATAHVAVGIAMDDPTRKMVEASRTRNAKMMLELEAAT